MGRLGLKLLFVLAFMTLFYATHTSAEGNASITGQATTQQASLSVVVIGSPSLALHSPKNQSYFNSTAMFLNYTASGAQKVWYRLGNGTNITITAPITFNVSFGSHTLFLFANSSTGLNSSKNVTFYVNASFFSISFGNFSGQGNTTNFNQYSHQELQNLTGVVFEKSSYGKIDFGNQPINLTNAANSTYVDFDKYINISFNKIEVDSSQLIGLNKSATLAMESLTFTNPRLVRDGVECPSTICQINSYNSGVLSFNVSYFSSYSAEETPTSESESESSGTSGTSGGSSGGGGGSSKASTKLVKDFSISKDQISIKLKQGETKKQEIVIVNNGSSTIELEFSTYKINNFIRIRNQTVKINAGESYKLVLDVLVEEETIPDLYIGKVIIEGADAPKEVLFAIEVVSKNPLMDVKVELLEQFIKSKAGDNIVASVQLYNLGGTSRIDVTLDYFIKNAQEDVVYTTSETIAVETQASSLKTIKLPQTLPPGYYIVYVRATYEGQVASSSEWFSVDKEAEQSLQIVLIAIVVLLVVFILIVFILIKRRKT